MRKAVMVGVAVVLAGMLAGCGSKNGAATGWRAYPKAFDVTDANRSGPRALVALPGGCFVAVGMGNTGYGAVPATWLASGSCTYTRPVGAVAAVTAGPDGALAGYDEDQFVDAVAGPHGRLVAAGRYVYQNDAYGYDGYLAIADPGTLSWRHTADFTEPTIRSSVPSHGSPLHVGPAAVTSVPDGGLVAVGVRDVPRYPWKGVPTVWTSATGTHWAEARMPLPAGQAEATPVDVAVAPDGTLVAIGGTGGSSVYDRYPVRWRSTDGGRHWTVARLPAAKGTTLSAVVATGSGFTAVGYRERALSAVVLDSPDGTRWSADRAAAHAGARLFTAAVALPGGGLVVTAGTGSSAGPRQDERCAVAWERASSGTWSQESMGCHGIPTALAVLSGGRVAAAFWHTLWLSAGTGRRRPA